jgi:hypothetical protein
MEDEDFPISPGRAQQLFDHAAILSRLLFRIHDGQPRRVANVSV